MPKFCANLTMLWNELDFMDRFAAAAKAGFAGVEYLFPYDHDKHRIAARVEEASVSRRCCTTFPPATGPGASAASAATPAARRNSRTASQQAIEYATALGCKQANCLAGIRPRHVDPVDAREVFIKNLQYAAPRLKDAGIKLLIEAINTRDIPGFFLHHTKQALDIILAVGSDNLFVQYDIYHMQIMEGDLARTIETNLKLIPHLQLADNPGRNEPGTGEINYPFLFEHLDRIGYAGWIGCEYKPKTTTDAGLGWVKPYLKS